MSSSANAVICEEIFDETSHPSIDEIHDYANKIGIDPEAEPHLLPLATEGLMRALPPAWKPCYDEKSQSYYYYNNQTHKTQWEHPLDDVYRGLVKKKRIESQSLSLGDANEDATFTRDDLPSLDEPLNFTISPVGLKPLEPISLGARKKEPLRLADIKSKQKSEERPDVPKRLTMFSSFDGGSEKKLGELKLSGGGAMFLKSNTVKKATDEPSEAKPEQSEPPKGILRERSFIEPSKSMEFDKSVAEDDDRKSVRFNLDSNPDITFDFGDNPQEKSFMDVKITPKGKTRFSISPVKDVLAKFNNEEPSTMRLIKPNPKDFIKPKLRNPLESDNATNVSDSEDDSILKSIDLKVSNFKEKMDKSDAILESDNSLEYIKTNRAQALRHIKEDAQREVEERKKKIWEDMNEELTMYKENIEESQQTEMERILREEKEKCEAKLKTELDKLHLEMDTQNSSILNSEKGKLQDLSSKFKTEEESLESTYKIKLDQKRLLLESNMQTKLDTMEVELNKKLSKTKDELLVSHKAIVDQINQNHNSAIEDLKRQMKAEEQSIRKEHQSQLQDLKKKVDKELDQTQSNSSRHESASDERLYEKVRCEKRLLEDKYRCLKDKYLRLKTEVKMSIEKRNRRREQSTTNTTGSETERSNSVNKERSPSHKPPTSGRRPPAPLPSGDVNSNPKTNSNKQPSSANTSAPNNQLDFDTSVSDRSLSYQQPNPPQDRESCSDDNHMQLPPGRSRKKLFSRLKSSSASRINNNMRGKLPPAPQRSCSPVENLRRQLQKLEDLEDEFTPAQQQQIQAEEAYHLRYPFHVDGAPGTSASRGLEGSSELEFFRHRIHLERDSIKRAKESLRTQKCLFQQRQNDLKLKHGSMARHTLQQLCQEEKDLTDMEVSLHRTRSLLGEKVIRLRHLEQSLQRATAVTHDMHGPSGRPSASNQTPLLLEDTATTLSDLSSHSASSGISSTEFATAADVTRHHQQQLLLRGEHLQESSEIIHNLESLNAEIRDIWDVLNKQQQHTSIPSASLPPLPLAVYHPAEVNWPMLAAAAAAAAANASAATSVATASGGSAPNAAPPQHTASAPPSIPTLADRLHNYRQQVALANAQSTMVTSHTQVGGSGALSGTATTTTTTTLVERTRNLRHWLRQAGIDPTTGGDGSSPQATL